MLGRLVNDCLRETEAPYPWGDVLPLFQEADARICNLECVLSDDGNPWNRTPKVFHFRSDAKNIAVLKAAAINAVSVANNHALDFEEIAMDDMLNGLVEHGIHYAGAGKNLEEAAEPAVFRGGDMKIGFIAFTDNEPEWEATSARPGVFYVPCRLHDYRAQYLFDRVRETKKKVDYLIVSAHWGPNWGYRPVPENKKFGHALVDHGADIIFGHSCHLFQGIEFYREKPILYSTGNFIDDYAVDDIERNDESFIFTVEIKDYRVSRLVLHPTVIKNFQARKAGGLQAQEIAFKMRDLCAELKTEAKWNESEKRLIITR